MTRFGWTSAAALLAMLTVAACGTNGPQAGAGSFGDVAFSTYEFETFRVVFTTDSKAVKTWRNMSGPPVNGTYVKKGNEIEVAWDPKADHHGSLSEKFRQMGPCSIARYERVDKKGVAIDGSPQVYQRTKPRCDAVRVTN
ncbi:MAG: hypothetical protein ABI823_20405 [Bryobacteraceae bacterium]